MSWDQETGLTMWIAGVPQKRIMATLGITEQMLTTARRQWPPRELRGRANPAMVAARAAAVAEHAAALPPPSRVHSAPTSRPQPWPDSKTTLPPLPSLTFDD